MQERAQDFANNELLEESLEPVVHAAAASTEAITKELIPIKDSERCKGWYKVACRRGFGATRATWSKSTG